MSYRRTNEPSPLEVEGSTAGASGGGDLAQQRLEKRIRAYRKLQEAAKTSPAAARLLARLDRWPDYALMDQEDTE